MNERDLSVERVSSAFSSLLGDRVLTVEQIRGGRNSRVYAIRAADNRRYCGKLYFRRSWNEHRSRPDQSSTFWNCGEGGRNADKASTAASPGRGDASSRINGCPQRDSLSAEFYGLRFLWNNGVRCIPAPIAADPNRSAAVYEFVIGRRLAVHEITREHIDRAVGFLAKLKELTAVEGSDELPLASEAVFSVHELIESISLRLQRLQAVARQHHADTDFATFVDQRFPAALDRVKAWAERRRPSETCLHERIRDELRTLSPSDFGFHNALLRHNGDLVFLDFEYFGWDDPAKTISDFLLHPAVEIGMKRKRFFFGRMIEALRGDEDLADRVETMYPLFGLKWCMILLNEFLPEIVDRREFSGQEILDVAKLRTEQLEKSQRMLQRILDEYEHFGYRIR